MSTCTHSSQRYINGVWHCAKCNAALPKPRATGEELREKIRSARLNGMESMKQMRELGMTERQMTKQNLEMYKKNNPGKDPVRVDGKDRWI